MAVTQKVVNHISGWLRDYAVQAGAKGFVVGVSGGIDSALTSTLCALTDMRVSAVNMPIHQSPGEVDRAQEHIDWLCERFDKVVAVQVELTGVFEQLSAAWVAINPSHLALANTRARLRMTTLYGIAQTRNQLVAGTGNRVEDLGVGFFTKYGDGGVDLSPIANLMKTQVYALAACLGVPQSIQRAAPTDGLWGDGRNDEDQIGASYPELEWAMTFDGAESDLNTRQRKVLGIYRSLHRANQHKMQPLPVCQIPLKLFD